MASPELISGSRFIHKLPLRGPHLSPEHGSEESLRHFDLEFLGWSLEGVSPPPPPWTVRKGTAEWYLRGLQKSGHPKLKNSLHLGHPLPSLLQTWREWGGELAEDSLYVWHLFSSTPLPRLPLFLPLFCGFRFTRLPKLFPQTAYLSRKLGRRITLCSTSMWNPTYCSSSETKPMG